jgi:hypothetical protein
MINNTKFPLPSENLPGPKAESDGWNSLHLLDQFFVKELFGRFTFKIDYLTNNE